MVSRARRTRYSLLIGILILAAGLRLYRLDAQSFWNDEGNSARLSERTIPLIIEGTASDIHPPLYYLVLHGWREMGGESEFSLRLVSLHFGLLTVAVTYALGRALWERRPGAAVIAMLAAAASPTLVYYSQEARMYAMLAFLAALSTWLLIRWLRSGGIGLSLGLGYIATAAAGMYTHYFFPAVLVFHALLVLGRPLLPTHGEPTRTSRRSPRRRRQSLSLLLRFAGIMALVFLLYLPWLPIFIRQTGGREGIETPILTFVRDITAWMAVGPTAGPQPTSWLLGAIVLLGILGLVQGRRGALVSLLGMGVPGLAMLVTGAIRPEFFKFMLVAVPFLALLLGSGWASATRGSWLRPAWLVLFAGLLWGMGISLQSMYSDPLYARSDYRGIAQRIEAEDYPNAGIILNAPNQWEVFTYYHRSGAPVYPLPMGRPDAERIYRELESIEAQHDRLYVLFWGELQQDPEGIVEAWLDRNTFKATEEWVGDVRFAIYAVPAEASDEMAGAAGVLFGDVISLEGYTLSSDRLRPGEILQVTLFWKATVPLDKRYKVFLHLVDGQGNILAQQDGEPVGDSAPTDSWTTGQVIPDNHGILVPFQAAPGEYTLLLGLYELFEPENRLPIVDGAGLKDAYTIGRITISNE